MIILTHVIATVSQASPIPFLRVPILKVIGAAERNGAGSQRLHGIPVGGSHIVLVI